MVSIGIAPKMNLSATLELGRNQEAKLAETRDSYQTVRQNFTTFRDHLNGLRARLNSWHRQSAQLHENRKSTSGDLAVLDERQRTLLDNRQSGMLEQSRLAEEIKIAQVRLAETEAETARLQTEYDDALTQTRLAQAALEKRQVEKSVFDRAPGSSAKTARAIYSAGRFAGSPE